MRVSYHPEFPNDLSRFAQQYRVVSERLAAKFLAETDAAIEQIKANPTGAGHFLNTVSVIAGDVRRRNLHSFPFFILYGIHNDLLVIASLVPNRSDPLTWLDRISPRHEK